MPLFFTFYFFLSYDTVQNTIGSHHTIFLYDGAGVYESNWWSLRLQSVAEILAFFPQLGVGHELAPHTSEAPPSFS